MYRSPDSCPYRRLLTGREGVAGSGCELLGQLLRTGRDTDLQVDDAVCRDCCEQSPPTPERLNHAVASQLYVRAFSIGARGGTPGCDADRVTHLIEFAREFIPVVEVRDPDPWTYVPPFDRPCFHLGEPTPPESADAADGFTHRCRHELLRVTNAEQCLHCRYYDPRLKVGNAVAVWSVGVLTAPRRQPTLYRSLKSLAAAGWDEVRVFAEPGVVIPDSVPDRLITRRSERIQAWPNFLLALTELHLRQPHADAYLLCEDDVVYCRGLRAYLEQTLWPANRLGVVSLFTSGYQDPQHGQGFFPTRHGLASWGAQAYLFPNASARALLRHADVVNHRSRGPKQGRADQDAVVGYWCQKADLDYYMHSPSLAQHIGETSSLWETAELSGLRLATSFPGEEADIGGIMSAQPGG
ncbi:MAG TPA: hypothetical protein DCY13_18385 [Verrucomicrobiales bacterium]|nr:hypothetical protein [Verrucomicrobiales bacterium]